YQLSHRIGNLKAALFIPVSGDKGLARYAAGLIRGEINGAGADYFRTEHFHAAIAGNFSDRFRGDDPAGIKSIYSDAMSVIFQCQHLRQSLDTELGRGVWASQHFSFFSLRLRNIDDRPATLGPHDLESFPAA